MAAAYAQSLRVNAEKKRAACTGCFTVSDAFASEIGVMPARAALFFTE
ncbi:hypothetical protein N5J07_13325 [Comamonas aquatica]|nr:hypothetical protein [Comamonas aquatica]MDH0431079.1 hypothetical protein [Comamonas aquatica]MDH1380414.1 hypothetical protein [Comamonas aquatica]MDH1640888.1 hypothetical protein [Comamonas aquatica]